MRRRYRLIEINDDTPRTKRDSELHFPNGEFAGRMLLGVDTLLCEDGNVIFSLVDVTGIDVQIRFGVELSRIEGPNAVVKQWLLVPNNLILLQRLIEKAETKDPTELSRKAC